MIRIVSLPHHCCLLQIYGALPPETRRRQANLFNDPNSGYDVLVASDAVGLGLNLNIRRVVRAPSTTQMSVGMSVLKTSSDVSAFPDEAS